VGGGMSGNGNIFEDEKGLLRLVVNLSETPPRSPTPSSKEEVEDEDAVKAVEEDDVGIVGVEVGVDEGESPSKEAAVVVTEESGVAGDDEIAVPPAPGLVPINNLGVFG